MFPYLSVTNSTLPQVLYIDEFKVNTGNHRYQVDITIGKTHDAIDILECR